MHKLILVGCVVAVATSATLPVQGDVVCSGDSATVALDLRRDVEPVLDSIVLSWNAKWVGGNAGATVVIADNGAEVKLATGVGEFRHLFASIGRHDLTYTTYIDGVAQDEVYVATIYAQSNVVVFIENGGHVDEPTRWVVQGTTVGMLPVATRTGYTFVGWFTEASGGTQISASTTVIGDVTYYAHWAQPNSLIYDIVDGTATVIMLSPLSYGDIDIPAEIDGYPVVAIAPNAFANCTNITSVTVPNSVTNIGASAFSGCSGLVELTLPFVGSRRGNAGTADAVLGYIFGTLSYAGGTRIRQYFTSSASALYSIPSSLRRVVLTDETLLGFGAFHDCNQLTNVVVNDGVTDVGDRAFYRCSGLASSVIPSTVANIGTNAFRNCTGLLSVAIGDGVERIHLSAFRGCSNLVEVAIPDSVQMLGPYAFGYCASLAEITLPGVKDINYNAFYECTGLEKVDIHSRLNAIGSAVFYNCTNLAALTFFDDAPKTVRGNLFNGDTPEGCKAYVRRSSTGWGVVIPGTWNGIAIDYIHHDVAFDAVGGTCATSDLSIADGAVIEDMPVAQWDGHGFEGWFTAAEGGTRVDKTTVVDGDMTLYAHWVVLMLEEALDIDEGVVVMTSDAVPWRQVPDSTAKVGDTIVRSCEIGNRTNTWLSATVSGAGTMSFWYKVSCEHDEDNMFSWDRLMVYTNDVEIEEWRMDGETGWTQRELTFTDGENTVKWMYYKDRTGAVGEDCAWVDGVTWTPAGVPVDMGGGKSVTVPQTWIEEHPALVAAAGGDAETALASKAANGRMSVAECYVVGVDPESTTNDFKITSFPMKADGTPDLENIVFDPPEVRWNVEGARPVVKGAASLDGEWQAVTEENKASFRFFKVEVVLP